MKENEPRPHGRKKFVIVGLGEILWDAFTAVVAVGLLRKQPLRRINSAANQVAGFVCGQRGAWAELPEILRHSF